MFCDRRFQQLQVRDTEEICFAVGILTQVWSPDYIVGIFSEGAKNGIIFAIGFREYNPKKDWGLSKGIHSVKVLFMSEPINLTYERVDDLPLLLAQLNRMGVQGLLDKHFPTHGNWQGLSLGWLASIWLGHILSRADHRLSYVQPWAEKRLSTLSICTGGQSVRALDLSDDRLEAVLGYLSEDEPWHRFEAELGGHLVRVYDLKAERVRLDPTTASGYCGVSEEGLFQWGHSKNKRPDLAQVKIMLATLDPLALPVATEVLSGEKADDPLYIPAIQRVRETLMTRGLLYIGDCKMAARATRGELAAVGDYYLCPLPSNQLATGELLSYLQPVWSGISY